MFHFINCMILCYQIGMNFFNLGHIQFRSLCIAPIHSKFIDALCKVSYSKRSIGYSKCPPWDTGRASTQLYGNAPSRRMKHYL